MKKTIATIGRKITWFFRELVNLVGNLFVPVASVLVATAELLQLPAKLIESLKKMEYWLFKIGGTLPIIQQATKTIDKAIDKYETKEE